MGNLRDELIRKGLLDDKRARQMAHEERARRNKAGQETVAQEKQQQDQERRAREDARREGDRQREVARQAREQERQEGLRLDQMLRDHALVEGVRGPRRFHFVAPDRRIPYLDLSEEVARRLENGQLAICALSGAAGHEFVIVPAPTARRAAEANPASLLFLTGSPSAGVYGS